MLMSPSDNPTVQHEGPLKSQKGTSYLKNTDAAFLVTSSEYSHHNVEEIMTKPEPKIKTD